MIPRSRVSFVWHRECR